MQVASANTIASDKDHMPSFTVLHAQEIMSNNLTFACAIDSCKACMTAPLDAQQLRSEPHHRAQCNLVEEHLQGKRTDT